MIPTIIQGFGMAFFFVPLMTLIMAGLPPERIPAASGLTNFARITAGAFGTSNRDDAVGEPGGTAPLATRGVDQQRQRSGHSGAGRTFQPGHEPRAGIVL